MPIYRAKHLGFCSGVKRALSLAMDELDQQVLYAVGDLVHNQQVIQSLTQKGFKVIDDLQHIPNGASVIIRAHGITLTELNKLKKHSQERDLKIIDATCPSVQHIFNIVSDHATQGYQILILGEHGHPEVEATYSRAGQEAYVISSMDELTLCSVKRDRPVAVVAQSTLELSLFSAFEQIIRRDFSMSVVFNTVCLATKLRQEAAIVIARNTDRMIIIGGKKSANTKHLHELCLSVNPNSVLVESTAELVPEWFKEVGNIGITAGASTPEWIIEEVETKVMEWEKQLDTPNGESDEQEKKDATTNEEEAVEVTEESVATEAPETEDTVTEEIQAETQSDAPEQSTEEAPQEEDPNAGLSTSPQALVEAMEMGAFDLPRHSIGDVINAVVVNIRSDEVMVDVGLKSEGIIPRRELSYDTTISPEEIVKVGDTIEVEVIRSEDQEGRITFSKKRADQRKHWDKVLEQFEKGEIIEGKIVEVIKGGLLVDIGVRGFMPASQAERRFTNDLRHLVGTTARVKLIEVERNKRAIVSRKAVLDMEDELAKEAFWGKAVEGEIVHGVVRRLTDFGAFVDIGRVDGLLHISDMAYHRVSKPSDIVSIGQEIDLKILKLSPDTGKVSLGLKQIQPKPWEALIKEIHPNDIIEGVVVRITAWGAFVNVRPGIDGLIHISELDNQRVNKVDDVIAIGDKVQVLVLSINPDQERLSLSLKALKPVEVEELEAALENEAEYHDTEYSSEFAEYTMDTVNDEVVEEATENLEDESHEPEENPEY